MKQIIKNEWRVLLRNANLLRLFGGFLIVFMLAIFLSNKQHDKQLATYNNAKDELRAQWESIDSMNPHSAAHYGTYVFKPSNVLTNLDEGVNSVTGNVLRVEGHVQNEMVHSEASQMMSVSKFGKLKASLLLQYIVPLLLIFLAFSSVSSERQQGRLKILLLQGATPSRLMLSKAIAIWLFGLTLLGFSVLVYTFLNFENFNSDLFYRLIFFITSYSLYYFIIVGLTVFLSTRFKNPTMALTSMIGIWILWTVFIPNIVMSSVEKWHPLPSRNEFKTAMQDDRSKGIDGHNPRDRRGKDLEKKVLAQYKVDSLSQLPINFDGIRMQADEDYGNIVWDKHFGNLSKVLQKQKQKVQLFGIVSPLIALKNSSMGYAGSDNFHHQAFLRQVEDYRRVFIKQLNDEHAYGGSKTGNWRWKAQNDFFKSIKDFEYKTTSIKSVLKHYANDNLILVLWSIFTVVMILLGTKRMDIV
ncbi:DUF3526 domain-containing protein [Winogradskyella sp.]|uniref:ABC transporter permease n=1 Tax=Winogradskyella sp. TaxID=1883156 RepID=UPI0025EE5B79|nr:DUF3526 domain-containing protein [Winogradskyella sp.]MCT4630968.1 DUF3526 domain-containing protein [Winogradskyella sp.]